VTSFPLSSVAVVKKTYIEKIPPLSSDDVQMEPRKIYEVVPPIGSQPKNNSLVLSTNLIEQTNSQLFSGQFHYPPETEETEINENDPENMDVKSVLGDLPEISPPELLSLEEFRREQSALPYDRVLIFVPEYVDNMERELTETTVDFLQSNPVDTNMARSSFVPSSQNLELSNKLNIKDIPALIRTAPKIKPPPVPKPKIVPPSVQKPKPAPKPKVVLKPVEVPNKVKANLTNTMRDKPVKHSRVPTEAGKKPSPPQKAIVKTKNNTDVDKAHFFSDFGKEGEGEENFISIEPIPFVLPIQSEITTDDNTSSVVFRKSQASSLNTHSSKEQQPSSPAIQNNNKHGKEKQIQRIDARKKHSITSTPKIPAKKSVPISTHGKMKTKFPWDDTNGNENRVDMLKFGFNISIF
jgi:hypothetical protein